jgi:N4-gp56 family major capsid protein
MANITSSLSALMQLYYDRTFILRQRDILVWDQFGQTRNVPANQGANLYFTRYSPLARVTTPLTQAVNPVDVNLTAANVTATLAEYGNWTKIGKLLALTAIDPKLKESVGIMAQNAGETIDRVIREVLFAGAGVIQYANQRASLATLTATDVMTALEIRRAIRTLKQNLALRFEDGFYVGILGPSTTFDVMGDNVWINAKTYSDVKDLYRGEVGELNGARLVESTDQRTEASTITAYSNFFMGKEAYGTSNLAGDEQKVYVKVAGPQSTENPLERYSTVGWAQTFASMVLVPSWVVNVKSAAGA